MCTRCFGNCSEKTSVGTVQATTAGIPFGASATHPTLDALGWQIVTTGEKTPDDGKEQLCYLVVATLLAEDAKTIFHVAPVRVIPTILRDGLLRSDDARSLTRYPDTLGKIHGSKKLNTQPGEYDGAAFWMKHFGERYGEPFGILAVDLTTLPADARVYRDTHSHWGVVIDRVERIRPSQIREIAEDKLSRIPSPS
jgi:hypothetical protein